MKRPKRKRCEGWRRYGGAFTLGPVRWEQCKSDGIVMLTLTQDGKKQRWPACRQCWHECIASGMKIHKASPI